MIGETDNLPQGGTDNANPSTDIDNPDNWNFADPDEEKQDNGKAPATAGTEGEKAETAEGGQEAEQSDEPDEQADDDEGDGVKAKSADDTVLVELPGGEKVPVSELRSGYMRQQDYTRGKQFEANRRNEFEAFAQVQHQNMRAIEAFLSSTMPPRPDPQLAYADPPRFIAMKAQYDAAVDRYGQAQQFVASQEQAMGFANQQSMQERLEDEKSLMTQAIPSLATHKGRQEFFNRAKGVGAVAGFSDRDIADISDHRFFVLYDLASEGLAARKARQTAKAKVANVPPVAPSKRSKQGNPAMGKNQDAMRRLSRSGSIKDAMMVDFE
jgi:hypothetical protein